MYAVGFLVCFVCVQEWVSKPNGKTGWRNVGKSWDAYSVCKGNEPAEQPSGGKAQRCCFFSTHHVIDPVEHVGPKRKGRACIARAIVAHSSLPQTHTHEFFPKSFAGCLVTDLFVEDFLVVFEKWSRNAKFVLFWGSFLELENVRCEKRNRKKTMDRAQRGKLSSA